jgi:hypothetical protein
VFHGYYLIKCTRFRPNLEKNIFEEINREMQSRYFFIQETMGEGVRLINDLHKKFGDWDFSSVGFVCKSKDVISTWKKRLFKITITFSFA